MEQFETEFIETLRRLIAGEKKLAMNTFDDWNLYGFHFEENGAKCPVCNRLNARWIVTYQYKGTMERYSVCNYCAGEIIKTNANTLIRSYLLLKDSLDNTISRPALDFSLKAKVVDFKGYQAYKKISDFSPTIRLSEKQMRLIRAVNYQFVKLIRDRMPNKDKSSFSEEFIYLPL